VACTRVMGLCIVLMSLFRPLTRAARGRVDARDAGGLVPGQAPSPDPCGALQGRRARRWWPRARLFSGSMLDRVRVF